MSVRVCLKVACSAAAGGHDHPNPGGCPMCERCCLGEEAWLKGSPLSSALDRLLEEAGGPVTTDLVRERLEVFIRPDAPDQRVEATCEAVARRVNALLDGSWTPDPARPVYQPFPGQHLGDTFDSEPFTPCEVCGGLFVWWINRPRVCNRMPCRPELHRQEDEIAAAGREPDPEPDPVWEQSALFGGT